MTFSDFDLRSLDGEPLDPAALDGRAVLVVNVASRCGMTPQYEGLERLQRRFGGEGFTVLGVPCNQFAGQEPGSAEEIREFCATTYGVSFPMTEKLEVNGAGRHPLYEWLTAHPAHGEQAEDGEGEQDGSAADVQWNFEKFLVGPDGEVAARFRPAVTPESDEVVGAIERALA